MKPREKKGLLLFSGGLDSTVVLHEYDHSITHVLHINYGQSNFKPERAAVEHFANLRNKMLVTLDTSMPFVKSALLGHAGYSYEVPWRNLLFVMHGTNVAIKYGLDTLYTGIYEDDSYYDTTDKGIRMLRAEVIANSSGKVDLATPYKNIDKYEIFAKAKNLGIDYEKTHSCFYEKVCGKCPSCLTRADVVKTIEALEA